MKADRGRVLFAGLVIWAAFVVIITVHYAFGQDAAVYQQALGNPIYSTEPIVGHPHYLYAPVFAQLLGPLAILPAPAFIALWCATSMAVYVWLLRPVPMPYRVPLLVLAACSSWNGNIEWLLALVCLARSGAWAIPLLTKVAPAVGGLWHVVRGEWGAAARAAGWTTGLVFVSFLIGGIDPWRGWIATLTYNASHFGSGYVWLGVSFPAPLVPRVLIAAVIVVIGARKNWLPALPIALVLAQPDMSPWTPMILAAVPRLAESHDRHHAIRARSASLRARLRPTTTATATGPAAGSAGASSGGSASGT